MVGLVPVYVINLPSSRTRRRSVSRSLRAAGVDFEIMPAVDGNALDETAVDLLCDRTVFFDDPSATPGMLGCALSHLELYRRIAADGAPAAVVLEDDAVVGPGFAHSVARVAEAIGSRNAVALLYAFTPGGVTLVREPVVRLDGGALHAPAEIDRLMSTLAYVITREAAASMARVLDPIRWPPDRWGRSVAHGAVTEVLVASPYLATDALLSGTIEHGPGRAPAPLRNVIDQVPVLRGYLRRRRAVYVERASQVRFVDRSGDPAPLRTRALDASAVHPAD